MFNKYKYLYRVVSFAKDGFYIENKSLFDSLSKPFFYKCKLGTFLKPSRDYKLYFDNSVMYLGLRYPVDFNKPWLYQ